ncbi:MAG: sigma-70 family RNA polymerase sigma factor [Polyangiaceae bacterium]
MEGRDPRKRHRTGVVSRANERGTAGDWDRPAPREPPNFQDLYRRFFGEVGRWIRALGGPEADREDLVQDVFLIVHRRLPGFDGDNVAGWLFQITRHRVRDFRRLRWFRLFLAKSPVEDSLASPSAGPEANLRDKQSGEMLSRLVSSLPETQRVAFILFELEGYSGEEIARIQRVPVNTVWARIHQARGKLASTATRLSGSR